MTPAEIKSKVQDAHRRAMGNRLMQVMRDSGVHHVFRDVRLFGGEAGTDFVETNLDTILREAVAMAECKCHSLDIPVHGF